MPAATHLLCCPRYSPARSAFQDPLSELRVWSILLLHILARSSAGDDWAPTLDGHSPSSPPRHSTHLRTGSAWFMCLWGIRLCHVSSSPLGSASAGPWSVCSGGLTVLSRYAAKSRMEPIRGTGLSCSSPRRSLKLLRRWRPRRDGAAWFHVTSWTASYLSLKCALWAFVVMAGMLRCFGHVGIDSSYAVLAVLRRRSFVE